MTRKLALFIAAAALAAGPSAAHAAPPALSVEVQQRSGSAYQPVSFFDIEVAAGERTPVGRVRISNPSAKSIKVGVEPVDATTAANLGFAYEVAGVRMEGPTRWIQPSHDSVTIAPRGVAVVDVAVHPPPALEAGDYLAGLSIEAAGQRENPTGGEPVAVSSSQRHVVGIQMRAPGPRQAHLALRGADVKREPAGVTFLLNARNDGNVMLTGVTGTIQVTRDGEPVAKADLGPGTFVTGTSITYPLLAQSEHPPEGTTYQVRATLRYAGGQAKLNETVTFGQRAAERDDTFSGAAPDADGDGGGVPAWTLALAALGLLAIATALARRRRGVAAAPDLPPLEDVVDQLRERGVELRAGADGSIELIETDGGRSTAATNSPGGPGE